jgi:hypothetical protein
VYSKATTINLYAAPREVLMALPGMTPEIADAIITTRTAKQSPGIEELKAVLGTGYAPLAPYIGFGSSNAFTIDALGWKDNEKKAYPVRATVVLEGNGKFRYVYYKSPMSVTQ